MTTLNTPPAALPLGRRIRWAREKAEISQERLAERIGTSRRHMIRIEKGAHRPGKVFIARIAEATGQPLSFFADEDDDEEADLYAALAQAMRDIARHEAGRMREEIDA